MGKIETKQIPSELHPSGGRLLKIMWDDKEPPKDYVWGKGEDEYYIWNGKKWIPYEFELIKNKGCIQKHCGCITKEEMAVKFDKFKKDVLAAVLKMNQTQDATNIADIRAQLAELKVIIHQLEEFDNYYTKEEIDNNFYQKNYIDEKTTSLNNLTIALNNSVSGLSRRIAGLETNLSDIIPTINRLDAIDHTQFITARDVSEEYDWDDTTIDHLEGYATKDFVERAIAKVVDSAPEALDTLKELSNALGNDSNFAANITNALANKADKSEIPEEYDDSELVARIETLEHNPLPGSGIIERLEVLESKPFDQYLTDDEAIVISTSLNDINERVTELESKPFDEYLAEDEELTIAAGLNDLNTRLSKLEDNYVRTGDPLEQTGN